MKAAHKEMVLLGLVGTVFRIDADGAVWRVTASTGGNNPHRPVTPRRAEQAVSGDGYLRVQGRLNNTLVRVLAHRLVWVSLHGRIPDGLEINHKNGNPRDNRPDNLELVTPRGNVRHRQDVLGHKPPGGYMIGSVKLTEMAVAEIRAARRRGASIVDLAEHFGVTPQTIHFAAAGKTWKHVTEPPFLGGRPKADAAQQPSEAISSARESR